MGRLVIQQRLDQRVPHRPPVLGLVECVYHHQRVSGLRQPSFVAHRIVRRSCCDVRDARRQSGADHFIGGTDLNTNTLAPLSGRAIIVTGGGTGIGRACAASLAEAGATVMICGRTEARLVEAVES
ncbi:MAG: SDR family NAD(P)-dependent oxidoreductase, partial [Acidobacteria bacterium]|nr:SDR family NAD(P)-dependent oxidoreductase [Acidobacteriota bacterium]